MSYSVLRPVCRTRRHGVGSLGGFANPPYSVVPKPLLRLSEPAGITCPAVPMRASLTAKVGAKP